MPEELGLARHFKGFAGEILSVSQLNRSVRDLLEHRFPLLWVRGEISNYTLAKSGHAYFVLKDAQAQIRCAMFRNRHQLLDWVPRDGIQVEVQALVTLYEARGEFQLVAQSMRRAGQGALHEAFLRLKAKLESEGLFDAEKKRPLPYLPRRIGVITSAQAAALRDVLTTLARRNPSAEIIIYPSQVQGEAAASGLIAALGEAGRRRECDVLLLCRGGGSIEDLWAFNDENLARAIRACPIPVISGVGHETDFTIADFAADARAPTPTAAAEMASPARTELLDTITSLVELLRTRLERDLGMRAQTLDYMMRRLRHPGEKLRDRANQLQQLNARAKRALHHTLEQNQHQLLALRRQLAAWRSPIAECRARVALQAERLETAMRTRLVAAAAQLATLHKSVEHLAPQSVLERGYSIARDASGRVIRDGAALNSGEDLDLSFSRGSALVRVIKARD